MPNPSRAARRRRKKPASVDNCGLLKPMRRWQTIMSAPYPLIWSCFQVFLVICATKMFRLIANLPMLCKKGGWVIWNRHLLIHKGRGQVPAIREFFQKSSFEEIHYETTDSGGFAVGRVRFDGQVLPLDTARVLFQFVGLDRLLPPSHHRDRMDYQNQQQSLVVTPTKVKSLGNQSSPFRPGLKTLLFFIRLEPPSFRVNGSPRTANEHHREPARPCSHSARRGWRPGGIVDAPRRSAPRRDSCRSQGRKNCHCAQSNRSAGAAQSNPGGSGSSFGGHGFRESNDCGSNNRNGSGGYCF